MKQVEDEGDRKPKDRASFQVLVGSGDGAFVNTGFSAHATRVLKIGAQRSADRN